MNAPEKWSAKRPTLIGFAAIVLLMGGLGYWSFGTQIAGAIVATGVVQLESDRQVVQHPDGGVVGKILARDGDIVRAGDVLIRLDGTFLRSELTIVEGQLAEIFARETRLTAERDDRPFPVADLPNFVAIGPDIIQGQVDGQRNLFQARQTSLRQEQESLVEQKAQIAQQILGVKAQLQALERQLSLIEQELKDVQSLFDRGLVPATRLLELQRVEAQLQGEIGQLVSTVAEARTRTAALDIEVLKLFDRRREEAISRLRDIQYSKIELHQRRISLTERLSRLDVRAPLAGTVFDSRVLAVQGVVQPAEPMMYLVPGYQPLQVSARIDPIDVDQVFPGQDVALMFTTFNSSTTPEVSGIVLRVSPDAQTDDATGLTYYEAVVEPSADELAVLHDLSLLPGMPVETFVKTDDHTPISYLIRPLTVYFGRAFREE
ncbi:MAG: HlyD family type I secretion periplasmic adaptor subunit [Boseongicola sp.]|nr:MAG: HlyD family type I secretion periplasmic adaptor subunit [Boseongicola sp.]